MMQTFRTESNYRSAARLTAPELRAAQQRGEILQSTALPLTPSASFGLSWGVCGA